MPTTTPKQYRLYDADLARIDRIRAHYGLSTDTEAVRLALTFADPQRTETETETETKSTRGAAR